MVTVIAMEVLPEERDRKYYADNYSCCPPPFFVIFVTLMEVSEDLKITISLPILKFLFILIPTIICIIYDTYYLTRINYSAALTSDVSLWP